MPKEVQQNKFIDIGLLILRVGIGIMFIGHGWGKLIGGIDKWEKVGSVVSILGIDFGYVYFGFMASFAEVFGGLALILGIFMAPASLLLLATMFVATYMHIVNDDPFSQISHSLEMGIVFIALIFLGPGRYSARYFLKK